MLNKQLILTGALTAVLVAPMQAKAGWPTVDIATATAFSPEVSARNQPAAAQLQRIEQVLETLKSIQATATAAMAGDLQTVGQNVAPLMKRKTFTGAAGKDLPFEKIAKNGSSPEEVSKSVWDTYFLPAGTVPTISIFSRLISIMFPMFATTMFSFATPMEFATIAFFFRCLNSPCMGMKNFGFTSPIRSFVSS